MAESLAPFENSISNNGIVLYGIRCLANLLNRFDCRSIHHILIPFYSFLIYLLHQLIVRNIHFWALNIQAFKEIKKRKKHLRNHEFKRLQNYKKKERAATKGVFLRLFILLGQLLN